MLRCFLQSPLLSRSLPPVFCRGIQISHEINQEQIVEYLDRYIIGQKDAKKALAIAIRDRWRRKQLPKEWRQEVTPANILMKGSTGTGKTEIARRLATLVQAPFIKVEATKYTEIGYVGQDTKNMIKDLMKIAVANEIRNEFKKNWEAAKPFAEEEILSKLNVVATPDNIEKLHAGDFDDQIISITVEKDKPSHALDQHLSNFLYDVFKKNLPNSALSSQESKQEHVKVSEAMEHLRKIKSNQMLNKEEAIQRAKEKTEQEGIVFIDEIDKLASSSGSEGRSQIKGPGVQRELLSLIEGCTIHTEHGPINTDHILFIGSGAFHQFHPSDLLPELQGRLPVRVQLSSLTKEDLIRILAEKEFNLIEQTKKMLQTEGVELEFEQTAIERIAEIALLLNNSTEDIGARRLITVLQKVIDDLSFCAHQLSGTKQVINVEYVNSKIGKLDKFSDKKLSKYII